MAIGNSTNDKFFTYVSPVINLKTVAVTDLFTTLDKTFIPTSYSLLCEAQVGGNSGSGFNVSWTGAGYSDFINGDSFNTASNNTYTTVSNFAISPKVAFPANTTIKLNMTSGDGGTSATGRIIIVGTYIQ